MKNKYMLDSSAWIEYFKGSVVGEKVNDVIEKEEILICTLSIAEISDKFAREKEDFEKFLVFIKNVSAIIDITISSCSESGKLKMERRKVKKEFSLADAIIYLTAKENSCILMTKDRDFEDMKDIVII